MFKRTVLLVVCIAGALALFTAPVHATQARDMGLGLYEYPWMIDGLQSYIYENPAYLGKFDSQVFFVRTDENSGGLIYSPVKEFTIGVFSGVNSDDNLWNGTGAGSFFHTGDYVVRGSKYRPVSGANLNGATIDLIDPIGNSLPEPDPGKDDKRTVYREPFTQQDVNLMASYVLNKMAFGLSLGYGAAWSADTYEDTTAGKDEYSFSSTQIDAVLAWLFAFNNTMSVDVDARYTQYVLSNKYDATVPGIKTELAYESNGAMDIAVDAGFNWDYTNLHKLHARGGYAMLNHSATGTGKHTDTIVIPAGDNDFDIEEKYDRTGTRINVGVSDEMRLTKTTIGFLGFEFMMTTFDLAYAGTDKNDSGNDEDYSDSVSSMAVPLIIGIESKMSENWTGRFSVMHNIWDPSKQSLESKIGSAKTTKTSDRDPSADTQLNIGLSYQLGSFRFDWLANIDIFKEGPYIISGKSTTMPGTASTPLSMAFGVTYLFGGPKINESPGGKSILDEM